MVEKSMMAGWGDMDFNGHMRNTAYLDKSADVRMQFFAENGFAMQEFSRRKLGPVILRDELEYRREVGLLEMIRVTLQLSGLSEDGSRWSMCNEFYRSDGALSARVVSFGGWLDLATRRLTAPPEDLLSALKQLPRSPGFQNFAGINRE